jgi:hypothetical protein
MLVGIGGMVVVLPAPNPVLGPEEIIGMSFAAFVRMDARCKS